MKNKLQRIVIGLIIVGLFSANQLSPALADTPINTGLTIAPLRFYPTQPPGAASSNKLQISNYSKTPLDVALSTELFTTTDESYDYSFSSAVNRDWIKFNESQFSLQPNERKLESFTISVPADAKPGGYYFSLTASTIESPSKTSFTEVKRVSALVYLEVSGAMVHKVNLLSNDIPWFTTSRSLVVSARLSNAGTTHERVSITLPFRYLPFGGRNNSQSFDGLILPATIRRLDSKVELAPYPGLYKVNTSFSPPQGGTTVSSHYVLYMPVWFMASLAYLGLMIGRRYYKIRQNLAKK